MGCLLGEVEERLKALGVSLMMGSRGREIS